MLLRIGLITGNMDSRMDSLKQKVGSLEQKVRLLDQRIDSLGICMDHMHKDMN